MSNLFHKLEADTEVQASANKVYEFFKHRPYCLINFPATNIRSAELLQGHWGNEGCVIRWNYSYDGKAVADTEMIESVDDQNRSLTLKMMEGHLLEVYKSFKVTIRVTSKSDDEDRLCRVQFIMEYEKLHAGIMDPHGKLLFSTNICKEIESFLIQEDRQGLIN